MDSPQSPEAAVVVASGSLTFDLSLGTFEINHREGEDL